MLSAIDAFFDHRGLWVVRTLTLRKLQRLRLDLDFYIAGAPQEGASDTTIVGYLDALKQILIEDQQSWLRLRTFSDQSAAESQS